MSCIAGLALSLHIAMGDGYNMNHPYIECKIEEASNISIGTFVNSEDNPTGFVKYKIEDHVDLEVGVVIGYDSHIIAPMVRLKYKKFFVMPGVEDNKLKGIVLGIEIPIIGEK